MRVLIQRMIDTGQERVARVAEVELEVLAELGPLLREAIKSGQRVSVWVRVVVPGRCRAETAGSGAASVGFRSGAGFDDGHSRGRGPAAGSRDGVAGLLQTSIHGRVTESQARLARDLARCLAWAWLERQR